MVSTENEVRPDATGGRVLLVDDEADVRRGLGRYLRSCGFDVTEAATAHEAAELSTREAFDVVVSDVCMPDMNGVELLRALREHDAELPVLLLSGTPDVGSARLAVRYGAFEYLTKPPDMEKLHDSVLRAVESRRKRLEISQELERYRSGERARRLHRGAEQGDVWSGALLGGRYRVGRLIGEGGMGAVYEAEREDLANMRVAVKVLHPAVCARAEIVARFRREAETIATLDHPNIVRIFDFQAPPGEAAFLVMERLTGVSLAQAIAKEGRLAPDRVAFIASQILAALGAAHAAKVIHRDLKPDNVFLISMSGLGDLVKLLDFGIAKLLSTGGERRLTDTGVVLGTPPYMAPEYARGGTVDERSDLYAVGCVMYEALTGTPPFTAENYNALLFAIQETEPRPLAELCPGLDPELAAVIAKAMRKDAAQRYQSAAEMAQALAPWVDPWSATGMRASSSAPAAFAGTWRAPSGLDSPVELRAAPGALEAPGASKGVTPASDAAVKSDTTPSVTAPSRVDEPERSGRLRRRAGAVLAAVAALALAGVGVLQLRPEEVPAPPPARPAEVRLHVRAFPGHAQLSIDGRRVPSNPYTQSFPRSSTQKHRIVAEAPDYKPESREMIFDQDEELVVALALEPLPSAVVSAPTAAAPSATAPSATARSKTAPRPPRRTAPSNASKTSECSPPYYFDARGFKKYKPQCLKP